MEYHLIDLYQLLFCIFRFYFVCIFVTDILNNGSYIIYSDEAYEILKNSFDLEDMHQGVFVKDILSRKKQVVPLIMNEMENK